METKPDDPINTGQSINQHYPGLTKREYFAAMAMQGMCGEKWMWEKVANLGLDISNLAVEQADMLIAELNKKEGE